MKTQIIGTILVLIVLVALYATDNQTQSQPVQQPVQQPAPMQNDSAMKNLSL